MTTDACPKGGNHAWRLVRSGKQYECAKCHQFKAASTAPTADFHKGVEDEKKPELEDEKKTKIPFKPVNAIVFLIEIAIFLILYFYTPIVNIVNVGLANFVKMLPENFISLVENQYFILGIVAAIVGIIILYDIRNIGALFQHLRQSFLVFDIVFIIAYIFWLAVLNSGAFNEQLCTIANTATLSQFSVELAQRCASYQQTQLPEYQKEGTSHPLEITVGYDVNGEPFVPTLYQGQIYTVPINLSVDSEVLTGVIIKGYIKNDTCYPGTDCVNLKSTGTCSEENPCTIPAGKSLLASLRSDQGVIGKVNTFVDLQIEVSYVDVLYGKGQFYIVNSLNDLQSLVTTKPITKTGPLDGIIYFVPNFFIASEDSTQAAIMYVAVANTGRGVGKIGNILVDKVGSFPSLGKAQCQIPWNNETLSEGSTYDMKNIVIPKGGNIQIACDINIDKSGAGAIVNSKDPFKGIPFAVSGGYQYFETIIFTPPKPIQKLGVSPG